MEGLLTVSNDDKENIAIKLIKISEKVRSLLTSDQVYTNVSILSWQCLAAPPFPAPSPCRLTFQLPVPAGVQAQSSPPRGQIAALPMKQRGADFSINRFLWKVPRKYAGVWSWPVGLAGPGRWGGVPGRGGSPSVNVLQPSLSVSRRGAPINHVLPSYYRCTRVEVKYFTRGNMSKDYVNVG